MKFTNHTKVALFLRKLRRLFVLGWRTQIGALWMIEIDKGMFSYKFYLNSADTDFNLLSYITNIYMNR